jgi:hypothetical protein
LPRITLSGPVPPRYASAPSSCAYHTTSADSHDSPGSTLLIHSTNYCISLGGRGTRPTSVQARNRRRGAHSPSRADRSRARGRWHRGHRVSTIRVARAPCSALSANLRLLEVRKAVGVAPTVRPLLLPPEGSGVPGTCPGCANAADPSKWLAWTEGPHTSMRRTGYNDGAEACGKPVVVLSVAADVNHRIQARRAAQRFATRKLHRA